MSLPEIRADQSVNFTTSSDYSMSVEVAGRVNVVTVHVFMYSLPVYMPSFNGSLLTETGVGHVVDLSNVKGTLFLLTQSTTFDPSVHNYLLGVKEEGSGNTEWVPFHHTQPQEEQGLVFIEIGKVLEQGLLLQQP